MELVRPTAEVQPLPDPRRWLPRVIELGTAFILSMGAVGSAWCSYQASLFGGQQASAYAEASSLRTRSTDLATLAGQLADIDAFSFVTWLSAHSAKNRELEQSVAARFRPELKVAFDEWIATGQLERQGGASTPFQMPSYRSHLGIEARKLLAEADALKLRGDESNDKSDGYERTTVLFALSLFFSGVVQQFKSLVLRITVLLLAGAVMLAGVSAVWSLPRSLPG